MKRILCFFGWHKWTCSISDIIDEFGYIPLDNRMATNSKCKNCNKKYSPKKD